MPAAATTSRKAAPSLSRGASRKAGANATSTDDLADQLASKLTISKPRVRKNLPTETPKERSTAAMRSVNASSQALTVLVQSGWKASNASPPNKKQAGPDAASLAVSCQRSLLELRSLDPGSLDIERAASSVVAKLIALELYATALDLLADMYSHLITLYPNTPPPAETMSRLPTKTVKSNIRSTVNVSSYHDRIRLLSLPLPSTDGPALDNILLLLISTFLTHSITALAYCISPPISTQVSAAHEGVILKLSNALYDAPTLTAWIHLLSPLTSKHCDSLLTRAYTALTKAFGQYQRYPHEVFRIRCYALSCLLYTSPSTVQADMLWNQCVKTGVGFARSMPALWLNNTKNREAEDEATRLVLSCFSQLHAQAEDREDKGTFLTGKAFVSFCEYWLGYAKRAGDIKTLDMVAGILHAVQIPHATPSIAHNENAEAVQGLNPIPRKDNEDQHSSENDVKGADNADLPILEMAKISAVIAQTTAVLECDISADSEGDVSSRIDDAVAALKVAEARMKATVSTHNESYLRAEGKLRRAIERLRRAAVKVLEKLALTSSSDMSIAKQVKIMLSRVTNILEHELKMKPSSESFNPAIDTLFVLARTTLNPHNPATYEPAYDFLSQAATILGLRLSNDDQDMDDRVLLTVINVETYSNYVRCLSGAFHNLAGTLYQASRYGPAIRFLRQGCVLGRRALRLGKKCGMLQDAEGQSGESHDDAWRQLRDQLTRRWELLGVCYSKIGDRKLSYDAFVECIKSYDFPRSMVQTIRTTGPGTVFDCSPAFKQIGLIVDRVTYMGACELMRDPSSVSLKDILDRDDINGLSTEERDCITGAILERQIQSLDGSRWKDNMTNVIMVLTTHALSVYDAQRPVRRAGVLLQCLEHTYYSSEIGMSDSALRPEQMGNEITDLLHVENIGLDSGLRRFCSQYEAATHFWLALHVHRRQDPRQSELVVRHCENACRILKSFLISEPMVEHSPKGKKSLKQAPPTRIARPRTAAVRTTSTSARAKTTKVAAKRSTATARLPRESMNRTKPDRKTGQETIAFETFERTVNLIFLNVQLVGLLGHVLIKLRLLQIMRRLSERYGGASEDHYIKASIDLAHEYVKLGKTAKAGVIYSNALSSVRRQSTSDEVRILFFLRFSESLAVTGNVVQSSSIYCEALAQADGLEGEDKGMSTVQRIQTRVSLLERSAMAASAFASLQLIRDDPAECLIGLLQSLRLWNRALSTLTRLNRPAAGAKNAVDTANPFDLGDTKKAISKIEGVNSPITEEPKPLVVPPRPFIDGLEWRIAEGLLLTLLALTQAYFSRGSAREAEYFSQQAQDLAYSLNAPAMVSRALAKKGEIQLYLGHLEDGYNSLVQAAEVLSDLPGPDAADIRRLCGEYNQLNSKDKDALELYSEAITILEELDKMFSSLDGIGTRRSSTQGPTHGKEGVLPALLSAVLRQHIWLLRDDIGDEYKSLLDRFLALPPSVETKAEENALLAKLTLHDVHDRFSEDMFLNTLTESTIALPIGISRDKTRSSPANQEILDMLNEAEKMFWSNISAITRRGRVSHIRDSAGSLALIRTFQTSLGKPGSTGHSLIANLLDASTSITLRREILEAIQNKFPNFHLSDDLQWPRITSNGSPLAPSPERNSKRLQSVYESDEEDSSNNDASLKKYWEHIREKYHSQVLDAKSLLHSKADHLPRHWTVVNIFVTEDKNTLFVTRQRARREPLIFSLPLQGHREGEDDSHLGFSDALDELKEIVRLSDEGTKSAVNVKIDDKKARAVWWADRAALDKRLQELLENIEFCWLGAFKTALSQPVNTSTEVLLRLRNRLDKIFKRSLVSHDKKRKTSTRLNDALLECFSMLSPKCRDEELEDFLYFILDLYQLHGTPVAMAEVDVDQVVLDLRSVLEEHATSTEAIPIQDSHLFLVLDKNVQGIPWESIPVLRGQSVSRIPSIDFLLDRMDLVKWHRTQSSDTPPSNTDDQVVDRSRVDPRSTYYVLNPSGDLTGTEKRFSAWVNDMRAVGWEGVVGKPPSEQQLLNALLRKDLVIYFGHGGAEQYVRSHKIRHLPRCAATMLWGCSSGALKEMGEFDRIGTPYNYMLAGCPTLVANLWDVTDRDIDKFSQVVFDQIHLTPDDIRRRDRESRDASKDTSIVTAVAKAREHCKLKYLTGAAPVVYGIPFYL